MVCIANCPGCGSQQIGHGFCKDCQIKNLKAELAELKNPTKFEESPHQGTHYKWKEVDSGLRIIGPGLTIACNMALDDVQRNCKYLDVAFEEGKKRS